MQKDGQTESLVCCGISCQQCHHQRTNQLFRMPRVQQVEETTVPMLPNGTDPKKAMSQACEEAPDICAVLLTLASVLLVVVTLPFSLCCVIKVVQVSVSVSAPE